MRVVSNTSPISNLAIIGRLDFLQRRYGVVRIPPAVAAELSGLSHFAAKMLVDAALAERWLIIENINESSLAGLNLLLDPGETEAIALSRQSNADLLLMDEKRGREAARRLGLVVAGALGELLHARLVGWIPAVRPEIARLRQDARFFVDPTIEQFILSQVGE